MRRGFSGETIVEYLGASETYTDFVNAEGSMVGSYVDAEGIYHAYMRAPDGRFGSLALPSAPTLDYFFVHGVTDTRIAVARAKVVGDVPALMSAPFFNSMSCIFRAV